MSLPAEQLPSAFDEQPCVGMFGSCGDTTFRQDLLIPRYEVEGIAYYNPQVAPGTWAPEMADYEADHLVHDVVQTWPATGDTYAIGTLSEQGFSFASSLRSESPLPKFIVPFVAMELSDALDNPDIRAESMRARKLVTAHLARSSSPNVYVTHSLDEMLEASVALHGVAIQLIGLARSHNPMYARYTHDRQEITDIKDAMAKGQYGAEAAALQNRSERR